MFVCFQTCRSERSGGNGQSYIKEIRLIVHRFHPDSLGPRQWGLGLKVKSMSKANLFLVCKDNSLKCS